MFIGIDYLPPKKKNRGEISFLRKDIIPENPQGLEVDEMAPEDIESLALCEAIIAFGQKKMFKTEFASLSLFPSYCTDHL